VKNGRLKNKRDCNDKPCQGNTRKTDTAFVPPPNFQRLDLNQQVWGYIWGYAGNNIL
jgi:hypothetical protein